jgi:hypothetical protein
VERLKSVEWNTERSRMVAELRAVYIQTRRPRKTMEILIHNFTLWSEEAYLVFLLYFGSISHFQLLLFRSVYFMALR